MRLKTQIPGPKSRALMEKRNEHVARGPFHVSPIFVSQAQGAILVDVDGNELIDLASGIGVATVGHGHPQLVEAIQAQSARFLHTSFNVTPYESYVLLCEKLNRLTPGHFPKKTFLANSGAEAVENAIKIARAFTGRKGVVSFEHAFHGRTYMAMSLTYKDKPYKEGFGPFMSDVYRAPFPYAYRWEHADVAESCFEAFKKVAQDVGQLAAVIIEPVLGEGGFVPAPQEFLEKLREFCDQFGVVLVADEIQTGFGRAGKVFACEALGLVPDLILTAKALGGGLPISAVTGKAAIMDAPGVGAIGGTFGGNPVACAAALQVCELCEGGDLLKQANRIAKVLTGELSEWKEKFPAVGDVRGLGSMQAVELVKDRRTKEPYPEMLKKLIRYCYEHGVIVMSAGSYSNVLRFLPPLVIEDKTLCEALSVVREGLKSSC